MAGELLIPESLTVHRGPPGSEAPNRIVPFLEYIQTVASCEIHPACSENAARALILTEVSHTLFRLQTNWYRQMGYDYDITDSEAYDQLFLFGHVTYEPINRLVYSVFPDYVQKNGLPCCRHDATSLRGRGTAGGNTVKYLKCRFSTEEILNDWFGKEARIVHRSLTAEPERGKNGRQPPCRLDILRKGNSGSDVRVLQIRLNCASHRFPAISRINPVSGVFDEKTQEALRSFRQVFDLPDSETVGAAAVCRLNAVYAGHKRSTALESRRLIINGFSRGYPGVLRMNYSGPGVKLLQYYLAVIGCYDSFFEMTNGVGGFDKMLESAVIAFQKEYGLTPDGIVGQVTWLELERACNGALRVTSPPDGPPSCPKETLRQNSAGDDVRRVQQWLDEFAAVCSSISPVSVTGHYGSKTQQSVRAAQKELGLAASGEVDPPTWELLSGLSADLKAGFGKRPGQYPGFSLEQSFRSSPSISSRRTYSERR